MPSETIGTPLLWSAFFVFVLVMLALDLGVFHRTSHVVTVREAAGWSAVWVTLSSLFGAGVWWWFGPERGLEFATGYLLEKALAVDNIFVFVIVFAAFGVPARLQHRVLFWGVLGALGLRALFIFAGAALVTRFHAMLYVFGALLAFTGFKLLRSKQVESRPDQNLFVRLVRKVVPVTADFVGERFAVIKDGKLFATPLLLALVALEATDVLFALDSIPAIFAVTLDPFIIFTSNILAVLGLRSMYFLLAGVLARFTALKTGLALILVFVGGKMLVADLYKVPIGASLGVIAALLVGSIGVSLWRAPKPAAPAAPAGLPRAGPAAPVAP